LKPRQVDIGSNLFDAASSALDIETAPV